MCATTKRGEEMTISFTTENDAFGIDEETKWRREYIRNEEIKRVLKNVCNQIDNGKTYGPCMDINGNKVGTWSLD